LTCLSPTVVETLTPSEVVEDIVEQVVDFDVDGRILEMHRYGQPELEHRIILDKLKMDLPKQPPKVYRHQLHDLCCGGN